MFRKPAKKRAVRQREDESDIVEESAAEIVRGGPKKKRRDNPMIQSSKPKAKGTEDTSSSSDDEATFESELAFPSGMPEAKVDVGTADIDTDAAVDAQAQFERVQQQLKEGVETEDGKVLYKGLAMYGARVAEDTARGNASSKFNRVGPIRAPQYLKRTIRWDYAPDICKDYKETGFCTFGDSCKFLHDRSDYKHGWEIERDYEAGTLNETDETNYEIPEEEGDSLPDECFICGNPFESPVVTRCKHYFCEACAIKAFRKSKKCRVCEQNTGGVFNVAKEIIEKMNGKKKATEKENDDASSGDEAETKPDVKTETEEPPVESEDHTDVPGTSEVKEEVEEEQGDEEATDDVEESVEDSAEDSAEIEQEQEEVEINMEEVGGEGGSDNGEDVDDEEEFDEGEAPPAAPPAET